MGCESQAAQINAHVLGAKIDTTNAAAGLRDEARHAHCAKSSQNRWDCVGASCIGPPQALTYQGRSRNRDPPQFHLQRCRIDQQRTPVHNGRRNRAR